MATAPGVSSRLGVKATQVFRAQCGATASVFTLKAGRRWISGDASPPAEAAATPAAEAKPTDEIQAGPAGQKPIKHLLNPVCLHCGGGHWLLECTQRPMNDWGNWREDFPTKALGQDRLTAITASLEAAGVITNMKAGHATNPHFTQTGGPTTTYANRLTQGAGSYPQAPSRRHIFQKPPQPTNTPESTQTLANLILDLNNSKGDGPKKDKFQERSDARGGARGGYGQGNRQAGGYGGKGGQTGGNGAAGGLF